MSQTDTRLKICVECVDYKPATLCVAVQDHWVACCCRAFCGRKGVECGSCPIIPFSVKKCGGSMCGRIRSSPAEACG
eukprot:365942-Chlamydomonas_euryale.AAC.31